MFKPSATIHKGIDGKFTLLKCSEDPGECLDAYEKCKSPGRVAYIRKGIQEKDKKIDSDEEIEAKIRAQNARERALIESRIKVAEDELKKAELKVAEAKSKVASLKPIAAGGLPEKPSKKSKKI